MVIVRKLLSSSHVRVRRMLSRKALSDKRQYLRKLEKNFRDHGDGDDQFFVTREFAWEVDMSDQSVWKILKNTTSVHLYINYIKNYMKTIPLGY